MDKVPVFGTGDVGSIPTKGTGKEEATLLLPKVFCRVGTRSRSFQPTLPTGGKQGFLLGTPKKIISHSCEIILCFVVYSPPYSAPCFCRYSKILFAAIAPSEAAVTICANRFELVVISPAAHTPGTVVA